MRSARGDHHPPQPLEKQGSQRWGNPPGSQSKAGAEPRGFLLPHPLPGLDSGTQRLRVPPAPVHPSLLSPRTGHILLCGPSSPTLLWPPSFRFISFSPGYIELPR